MYCKKPTFYNKGKKKIPMVLGKQENDALDFAQSMKYACQTKVSFAMTWGNTITINIAIVGRRRRHCNVIRIRVRVTLV